MTEAHFTNLRKLVVETILKAETSIKVAVAYLTDLQILDILLLCCRSNKKVELIISDDEMNFNQCAEKFQKLIDEGCHLYMFATEGGYKTIMHHKFCTIDNNLLITGSYNWTRTASSNRENLILSDDKGLVNSFLEEFNYLKHNSSFLKSTKPYSFETGLEGIDRHIEGFKSGCLYLLGGFHSNGKTSFITSITSYGILHKKYKIGILTFKNSSQKITEKIITSLSKIDIKKIGHQLSEKDNESVEKAIKHCQEVFINDKIENIKILIDDMIKMDNKHKIDIYFIDDLNFDLTENNLRTLKKIARQLNSVVFITQAVRPNNRKEYIEPEFEDVQFGNIADTVILMYRPELYGVMKDEKGDSTKNKVKFKIHGMQSFYSVFNQEIGGFNSIYDECDKIPY